MSVKLKACISLFYLLGAMNARGYDLRNPLYLGVFPGFESIVLLTATGIGILAAGPETDAPCPSFQGNSFYADFTYGFYPSYLAKDETVMENRIGGGYYFLSWFGVGAEVNLSYGIDGAMDTAGIGYSTYLRWRLPVSGIAALFFDYGFGMFFSRHGFPSGGTKRNFMPVYGLGVNVHASRNHSLVFGPRHVHISNGQREDNPGFSGIGFFIGCEYSFAR